MRKREGFTLIELMIVVAIIALIAAFAIPALLRARLSANETGAIAALRSLHSNQETFRSNCVVDQDEDGTGEFGLFCELAGSEQPRGPLSGNDAPAQRKAGEFIQQVFGDVDDNGFTDKGGYLFSLYLPNQAEGAKWVPSDDVLGDADAGWGDTSDASEDAINDQEILYVAYAWPLVRGRSGNRVFMIDSEGALYFTKNDDDAEESYDGTDSAPAAEAAYLEDDAQIKMPNASDGETGIDGNIWVPLSN